MVPAGNKAKRLSSVNHTTKNNSSFITNTSASVLSYPFANNSFATCYDEFPFVEIHCILYLGSQV